MLCVFTLRDRHTGHPPTTSLESPCCGRAEKTEATKDRTASTRAQDYGLRTYGHEARKKNAADRRPAPRSTGERVSRRPQRPHTTDACGASNIDIACTLQIAPKLDNNPEVRIPPTLTHVVLAPAPTSLFTQTCKNLHPLMAGNDSTRSGHDEHIPNNPTELKQKKSKYSCEPPLHSCSTAMKSFRQRVLDSNSSYQNLATACTGSPMALGHPRTCSGGQRKSLAAHPVPEPATHPSDNTKLFPAPASPSSPHSPSACVPSRPKP